MSTKWKIGKLLNKNLFQVHRCILMSLRESTIALKLITLLSSDLQNQFGVSYWAISYYKYFKLVEVRNSRVTKSSYGTELCKKTLHFELLT